MILEKLEDATSDKQCWHRLTRQGPPTDLRHLPAAMKFNVLNDRWVCSDQRRPASSRDKASLRSKTNKQDWRADEYVCKASELLDANGSIGTTRSLPGKPEHGRRRSVTMAQIDGKRDFVFIGATKSQQRFAAS